VLRPKSELGAGHLAVNMRGGALITLDAFTEDGNVLEIALERGPESSGPTPRAEAIRQRLVERPS
jgi:hypothetical protein